MRALVKVSGTCDNSYRLNETLDAIQGFEPSVQTFFVLQNRADHILQTYHHQIQALQEGRATFMARNNQEMRQFKEGKEQEMIQYKAQKDQEVEKCKAKCEKEIAENSQKTGDQKAPLERQFEVLPQLTQAMAHLLDGDLEDARARDSSSPFHPGKIVRRFSDPEPRVWCTCHGFLTLNQWLALSGL